MSDQAENTPSATESGSTQNAGARVDAILAHLRTEDHEFFPEKIREHFIKLWEFEDAENLSDENQRLTTIALFIYAAHNHLDDQSVRQNRARDYITQALHGWLSPELEKAVAAEKASDNPFKAFVDGQSPKIDEVYSWENFKLEQKKADGEEWHFKMKSCWFARFFIRYGRTDYIETACMFDQIPAEVRKDYVNLKLTNLFAKLGDSCQFKYTPAKK